MDPRLLPHFDARQYRPAEEQRYRRTENAAVVPGASPARDRPRQDRDEQYTFRKPLQPASATRSMQPPSIKTDLLGRRRSVQRDGGPLGPRPLERTSKRFFSAGTSPSISSQRPFLPQSASLSVLEHKAHGSAADNASPASQSSAFLPSMDFDNFQSSMGSQLNAAGQSQSSRSSADGGAYSRHVARPSGQSSTHSSASTPRRSQEQIPMPIQAGPAAYANSDTLQYRPRFATQDPSNSAHPSETSLSSPRRLNGPAMSAATSRAQPAMLKITVPSPSTEHFDLSTQLSPSKRAARRQTLAVPPTGLARATMPTWSSSAKSVQQSPRHISAMSLTNPYSPVKPSTMAKLPSRSAVTPSSAAHRRLSGRMSGLGARTISPTDAQRLRRLSVAQPNSGLYHPPSPQKSDIPDLPSSSMLTVKTNLTPATNRYTPESLTSLNGPPSIPSSSSVSSLNTYVTALPRLSHSPSLSRLPLLKGRNVYSSAEVQDAEELVPPVPAIPKVYESPKEQVETPFFQNANVNRGKSPDIVADTRYPTAQGIYGGDSSFPPPISATGRSVTAIEPATAIGFVPSREPATPIIKKRPTQNMRLPPLNVLPLSTPTANRIASFPVPSDEVDNRHKTPTKPRNYSRTPTTPMTASKATFPTKYTDNSQRVGYKLRTSTSQHNRIGYADTEPYPERLDSQESLSATLASRQITPFSSRSRADQRTDEYTLGPHGVQTQISAPLGYRQRAISHSAQVSNSSSITMTPVDEPPTPQSALPLRRKFSLTWRRTLKTPSGSTDQTESLSAPEVPAQESFQLSGTVGQTGELSVRRDSSDPSDSASSTNKSAANKQLNSKPSKSTMSANRTPSWTPFKSAKDPKQAVGIAQQQSKTTPQYFQDDELVANEEMRKLAAKRKEVHSAAKETDRLNGLATAKEKMSPSQAIQSPMWSLNIYEKGEIIDYRDGVYFCGSRTARKHVGDISSAGTANFGYDDERGDYCIVAGDHLAYRYEVVDFLGKGSFGQVVRCIDHKSGGLCAVKIIRNKKRFHQQALVEVNILKKLKDWDPDGTQATLTVTSSFYFRSHLCIVTPCLSVNLYELIRANGFQGFSLAIIRRFAQQILTCLQLLQDKQVIHCDLKPENILLCDSRRADIRVIDFGSSCRSDEKVYTYIQSRFYRSPEVILGNEYGLGIDMWSFGCILAELFTGYPIFPGENEQEQLACIMEVFGPPPRDLVEKCARRKLFFDSSLKPRVTISSKGRRRRPSSKTLSASLKCADEAFLDFVTQCLSWDSKRRLRPDEALKHAFITREPLRRTAEKSRLRTFAGEASRNSTVARTSGLNASPTKRLGAGNAASGGISMMTPAKTHRRPLPEPPSTVLRNGTAGPGQADEASDGALRTTTANRRQSGIGSASSFNKSNAIVATNLGGRRGNTAAVGAVSAMQSASLLPRAGSSRVDLAGAAARESMGVGVGVGGGTGTPSSNGTRWR